MRKITYCLIVCYSCIFFTYGFQRYLNLYEASERVGFDEESLEEQIWGIQGDTCVRSSGHGAKNIKADRATIFWEDTANSTWEYYVQTYGNPPPSSSGNSTLSKEVLITKDSQGSYLIPNTEYEFFVRSYCLDNGYMNWEGPFHFQTLCSPVVLPLTEGFESDSKTNDCWRIVDGDNDGSGMTNSWQTYNFYTHAKEGNQSMRFYGFGRDKKHDDWLISPTILMDSTSTYQLSYYYKTNSFYENEFEVLLSDRGIELTDFSTTLVDKTVYKNNEYVKKTVYITGVGGDVHIAWHILSTGSTYVCLDMITIQKVGCIGPDDQVKIISLESDKATFSWNDDHNSQWEYYVQEVGGTLPIGSGTLSNKATVTVTRTSGIRGANFESNGEYEFFVRSTCGPGKNSAWIGPISFRIPCRIYNFPFWEGFNPDSETLDCWSIIDNNKDSTSPTSNNVWNPTIVAYEGARSMRFYGYQLDASKRPHDDWLISPAFRLDVNKYYRLKYHYSTSASYESDFRVVLSTNGVNIDSFTTVLDMKTKESDNDWKEEVIIIGGIGGDAHIAWHVTTFEAGTYLYVDNVFLEEVEECPEPLKLGSKNEKENEVTIFWNDDYGTDWEYVVQKPGSRKSKTGTITKGKEVIVTKDINGNNLEHTTEYEFYVRTKCENGQYSAWSAPHVFRTACGVFGTTFWEGFNDNSKTRDCWTVIDNNNAITNNSVWKSSVINFEGTHSMGFYGYLNDENTKSHDNWLISPKITIEKGKKYRLKYHYRVSNTASYDYEFEVLLSNSGMDVGAFNTSIVPKKKYNPSSNWEEEYTFFSGVSGSINIAWHVVSKTKGTYLYVDNVFVEEVTGCPEPLGLKIKDIGTKTVTLSWTDDMGGTQYEYFVQKVGEGTPRGKGISAMNKEVLVAQDNTAGDLEPNTDYEFYVRTDCGNGEFSVWSGPFFFSTLCDVYTTPFWEGFNVDSKTTRCWMVIDQNKDGIFETGNNMWSINQKEKYEGDRSMYISIWDWTRAIKNDDWLISPTIEMSTNQYVLKYHYKSSTWDNAKLEIVMSNEGIHLDKFIHPITGEKHYNNEAWQEEVIFFDGIGGSTNLGWHLTTTGSSVLAIDNVNIKEVKTCPEPYYVKITDQTATSIDVEWKQYGDSTEWELIVVDYGKDETAIPVKIVNVSGVSETTISGLESGKVFTIYIRAKCKDGDSKSDWSSAIWGVTKVGANDYCNGAMIIPVNNSLECVQTISSTLLGATETPSILSGCNDLLRKDVWFEFTAQSNIQVLKIRDLQAFPSTELIPYLYGAIYDQNCGAMTSPIECFTVGVSGEEFILKDLSPGRKYYIRIGNYDRVDYKGNLMKNQPDFSFSLCISTPKIVDVSPAGDRYSLEKLIKDIWINSNCDLVSNIRYQNGDGNPHAMTYNTVGYFNKGDADFPFEEGVVLTTNEVEYVSGPCQGGGTTVQRGANNERWLGDKDINEVINDVGGGPREYKRVTQLEFDFIPIRDSIKFEYLFASNSYHKDCTAVGCAAGALFAAWLIDSTTGEGQNLAKIKGTDIPIALHTITDSDKTGKSCVSSYPQLYWKHYANGIDDPLEATIDFVGMTKAMDSETVYVVPGRQYHIKLAVIDFCGIVSHSSAVFFNAGSFDLGDLDLGEDLLIKTNNALCGNDCVTIKSGLSEEHVDDIRWFKDGVFIDDAKTSELEVCESGTYRVEGHYTNIDCMIVGEKIIEVYPLISQVVDNPKAFEVCRYSLSERRIDLSTVEEEMFKRVDRTGYKTSYYLTKEEALQGSGNTIGTNYLLEGVESHEVYMLVEDLGTGCAEVFALAIHVQRVEVPTKPSDVSVCAAYVFPAIGESQHYYTESAAGGVEYKKGDILDVSGEHTIYVLQFNGEQGCYEEVSYKVNITAGITANVFDDVFLTCELYELKSLSEHNRYFTKPGGLGVELQPGMPIPLSQTIYVYAESEDGLCVDESSFTVTYEDCPIPRGISPNGDGLNDRFDLSAHGVESIKVYNRWGTEVYSYGTGYMDQWYGQSKSGQPLPDGTYYYVIIAHGKVRTGWIQINR